MFAILTNDTGAVVVVNAVVELQQGRGIIEDDAPLCTQETANKPKSNEIVPILGIGERPLWDVPVRVSK